MRFCPECGHRLAADQKVNEETRTDHDKAMQLNPDSADVYCERGDVHYEMDEYDKAVADYSKAIELSPNNADAHYSRGCTYGEMGEHEKAIADFNKAIQLDPNHALAYYNRGLAYQDMEEYDKAIADYDKAIELDPADADAYYNRGLAYDARCEVSKAVSDLQKCISLSTDPELTEDAQQRLNEVKKSSGGLTTEELSNTGQVAEYVAHSLTEGKDRWEISEELMKQGWPERTALQFVDNTEQELKERIRGYKRTPEGRQAMATQYKRHMLNGVLSIAGGIAVSIVTYMVAVLGAGFYLVAVGAVIFGIIEFFRGIIGWLRYRD